MKPTQNWKTPLSYVLLAGGFFLFCVGIRTPVESYLGQRAAAREFRATVAPVRTVSVSAPRAPRPGQVIGMLSVPRLDLSVYVVEGADTRDLRLGPGHLPESAMPGHRGNCVIAGHRDTHFRALKDIHTGDDIVMETAAGKFTYKVDDTSIVVPSNTRALQPTKGAVLNLITCYPFSYTGSAPRRFVVQARLADELSKMRNAR